MKSNDTPLHTPRTHTSRSSHATHAHAHAHTCTHAHLEERVEVRAHGLAEGRREGGRTLAGAGAGPLPRRVEAEAALVPRRQGVGGARVDRGQPGRRRGLGHVVHVLAKIFVEARLRGRRGTVHLIHRRAGGRQSLT